MSRSLLKCSWLVSALSLSVIGCVERTPQPAKPPANNPAAPSSGTRVANKLFDPLERDKDILAMKKPGHWQVKGQDVQGDPWEGYLVVEHDPNAYMTTGFFEWSSRIGGGRYRFEGKYDPATRAVRWTGFTVEDRFGGVANAHYQATLSPDGRKLLNGSWQGGISIPGTWTAEFLNEL